MEGKQIQDEEKIGQRKIQDEREVVWKKQIKCQKCVNERKWINWT